MFGSLLPVPTHLWLVSSPVTMMYSVQSLSQSSSPALTFLTQDDSEQCPVAIRADIEEGRLGLWGLEVPLPIRGSGRFEVLFLDDGLRIFRSGGSLAVQIKSTYL